MSLLYDNIAAIMTAVLASALAWIYGGSYGPALIPVVPWLFALLLELMIVFPQRHAGETTYDARARVWDELKTDPLTWLVVAFLALLLVPFFNVGLCPICDYPKIAEGVNPAPTIPVIPYCVNRLHHLNVVMWFFPALTAMLAVKHTLLKRGKRNFLVMVVLSGIGLAVLGFVQQVCGAEAPLWSKAFGDAKAYFFSTFGYPNMGGDYFTTLFCLAVALWRYRVEEIRRDEHSRDSTAKGSGNRFFWVKHLWLVPATIFFFAALTTLSRAAIILVSVLAIVFFIHSGISFLREMSRVKRVKALAVAFVVFVVMVLGIMTLTPKALQQEVDSLNTTEVLDRVSGRGQYHTRVATEIWKDNFLFGCGGWGYRHLCIPKMTDEELAHIQQVGGINVHNDYLQFLAEHGIIGFGLLVAMVVLLVKPVFSLWRRLVKAARFLPAKQRPARPIQIFALPAPVFAIYGAAVATLIHSFGDCAMRSPAVLTLFFCELAAADGFMPYEKSER